MRSRVDGCHYAVKCTRRRFRGEADRQNMLKEVYALAAVCDVQDTTNIVRYHQVNGWKIVVFGDVVLWMCV